MPLNFVMKECFNQSTNTSDAYVMNKGKTIFSKISDYSGKGLPQATSKIFLAAIIRQNMKI